MKNYDTLQLLIETGYPILLSFRDIEKCSGVSEKTFKNWQTKGELPFLARKYGGTRRAHIQDVVYWMETGESYRKKTPGRPTASQTYRQKKQSEETI